MDGLSAIAQAAVDLQRVIHVLQQATALEPEEARAEELASIEWACTVLAQRLERASDPDSRQALVAS
jgi:hypothetical protein